MSELQNQDSIRYPGSGSAVVGNTPFGTYDNDPLFVKDCYNATQWCASRLGFPIIDIELLDVNFYAAYEEAVNVYSAKVNEFNMLNNMLALQGQSIATLKNVTGRNITGTGLPFITALARDYGTETGTGGNVDWKYTSINVLPNEQDYDLQKLIGDVHENCNRITVRNLLHFRPPASARIYDPFSMTGMSYSNVLTEMGFGAYSPACQFLMTPLHEDLLRMQAIEFNDMIRKSQYSFELKNNKLRLFPIPTTGYQLWIEYTSDKEEFENGIISPFDEKIASDFANIPYKFHVYSDINDSGRTWIRNYFLAICKQILGCIRQKIQAIPIGSGESITLDGSELRSEATQEMEKLLETLKEMLEKSGKFSQMEMQSQFTEQMMEQLKRVPNFIYIG